MTHVSVLVARLGGAVAVLGLIAGCAGTTAPSRSSELADSVAPTSTTVPSASLSGSPAPDLMSPNIATFTPAAGGGAATWNIVSLGDSNAKGASDYPGVYAQLLADEQGVDIELTSYSSYYTPDGIMTIADWTEVLRADASVHADLGAADIVTVLVGFHDVVPALMLGECGTTWPDPLQACMAEATASMPADFDEFYRQIAALVPDEARVLVNDYGIPGPLYERWSSDPAWPEIRQAIFEDWRSALEVAATANGLSVIHTYAGMSAPDGKPLVEWSSITSDSWHFNAEGHRLIAEIVMREDGFGPPGT